MKKSINKLAWFLAILAGILTKPRGDWLDFLFGLSGAVMAVYLISLLFAWLLSLIADKEKRQEKQRTCLPWLMILFSTISIMGSINPDGMSQEISLVKTDKSSELSEQVGNLYRNTKYGFRIKFPEGWEIKPGDGPNILQKAVRDGSTISVGVRELSEIDESWTIKDVFTLQEYEEEMMSVFPDSEKIDSGETKIDNNPAYWIEYQMLYSALDVTVEVINLTYQVLYKNVFYTITAGASANDFGSMGSEFKKSISTFVFEDY